MVDNTNNINNNHRSRTRKIVEEFVSCLFRGEKVMPILHYAPLSPPCRSVLLLGRILNIDFDLRLVDVLKGDNMKPEFIEVCVCVCVCARSFNQFLKINNKNLALFAHVLV